MGADAAGQTQTIADAVAQRPQRRPKVPCAMRHQVTRDLVALADGGNNVRRQRGIVAGLGGHAEGDDRERVALEPRQDFTGQRAVRQNSVVTLQHPVEQATPEPGARGLIRDMESVTTDISDVGAAFGGADRAGADRQNETVVGPQFAGDGGRLTVGDGAATAGQGGGDAGFRPRW